MDLFHTQTCDIIFHSFAYTIDEYTLHCWVKKSCGEVNCFVNNNIRLAFFEVTLDDDYDIKEIGNEVMSDLIARRSPYKYYNVLMFYMPAPLYIQHKLQV